MLQPPAQSMVEHSRYSPFVNSSLSCTYPYSVSSEHLFHLLKTMTMSLLAGAFLRPKRNFSPTELKTLINDAKTPQISSRADPTLSHFLKLSF